MLERSFIQQDNAGSTRFKKPLLETPCLVKQPLLQLPPTPRKTPLLGPAPEPPRTKLLSPEPPRVKRSCEQQESPTLPCKRQALLPTPGKLESAGGLLPRPYTVQNNNNNNGLLPSPELPRVPAGLLPLPEPSPRVERSKPPLLQTPGSNKLLVLSSVPSQQSAVAVATVKPPLLKHPPSPAHPVVHSSSILNTPPTLRGPETAAVNKRPLLPTPSLVTF